METQSDRYAVPVTGGEWERLMAVVRAARRRRQTWEAVGRCTIHYGPEYCEDERTADEDAQMALNKALDALQDVR